MLAASEHAQVLVKLFIISQNVSVTLTKPVGRGFDAPVGLFLVPCGRSKYMINNKDATNNMSKISYLFNNKINTVEAKRVSLLTIYLSGCFSISYEQRSDMLLNSC